MLDQRMHQIQGQLSAQLGARETSSSATDGQDIDSTSPRFKSWTWGGRLHPVPQDFKLPRPPLKAFCLLWYHGDTRSGIQPLKTLQRFDVSRPDWRQVSRCRSLIAEVERLARESALVPSGTSFEALSTPALGNAFDIGYASLIGNIYGTQVRVARSGEISIGTLYNRWRKLKAKEGGQVDHSDSSSSGQE